MSRWQIIILSVAFIIVWMAGKRFLERRRGEGNPSEGGRRGAADPVEEWYGRAQERLFALDDAVRREREASWAAMTADARRDYSEAFLRSSFDSRLWARYTPEEHLKVGRAAWILEEPHGSRN